LFCEESELVNNERRVEKDDLFSFVDNGLSDESFLRTVDSVVGENNDSRK